MAYPSGVWARRRDQAGKYGNVLERRRDPALGQPPDQASGPSGSLLKAQRSLGATRRSAATTRAARSLSSSETTTGFWAAPPATSRTVGAPTTLATSLLNRPVLLPPSHSAGMDRRGRSRGATRARPSRGARPPAAAGGAAQPWTGREDDALCTASTPSSVASPVTRPPSTRIRFASQPSLKSAPSRRADSARAVVAPSASSVHHRCLRRSLRRNAIGEPGNGRRPVLPPRLPRPPCGCAPPRSPPPPRRPTRRWATA